MSAVEYRQLGRSGLRVSVPIFGAMSFGSSEWCPKALDEKGALHILKAAWDRGINTFDTANIYSNGESERIIGKFLLEFNIPRHLVVIATKCYGIVGADVGMKTYAMPELHAQRDYVNQAGLSRAAIFNAVDASLQRLGTAYIDLLQIHQFDPKTPVEETMQALHDLVRSGKVRYIGASCMPCWKLAYMNEVAGRNGWTRFVSVHNEHSLLYREEERELIPYCNFHGIGIIPWAPLAHGDLARPLEVKQGTDSNSMKPSDKLIVSRVEELAHKKGCTMSQIALLWSTIKVTSPVISGSSIQRLDDSLFGGLVLDEDEVRFLDELYEPRAVRGYGY